MSKKEIKMKKFSIREWQKLKEGLSSSDIKKATKALQAYIQKYKKDADGEAEQISGRIADILKWDQNKRDQLTDYLIDLNQGNEDIVFGVWEGKLTEGDNTQYSWGQINNALMKYGMVPKHILKFLSVLKKQ